MGPGMMGGAWGWIGGIFMMIFWILIIVALALFIRWLVSADGNRSRLLPGPGESAVDILKKRYARGEITKEQFESMKRDLGE
jgi:putative membrane protein